ncbi:MAG: hypothetical protein N2235_02195 [Fischerella sp.]|nr:hypothetical protein [Fischerella sp.]
MKTNFTNDYNPLFKVAARGLKYFLLTLLGFAIAYVMSTVFGVVPIVQMLQSAILWQWLLRIFLFIFCLFAIAMILDSWK